MEPALQSRILAGLAYAQIEAGEIVKKRGDEGVSAAESIALLHRDAARALEIISIGNGKSQVLKDFSRLEETLADIIIRTLEISSKHHMHLASATVAKMTYNGHMAAITKKDF